LYTGLGLDYRLRLWAPTSASRTISVAAELFVLYVSIPEHDTDRYKSAAADKT